MPNTELKHPAEPQRRQHPTDRRRQDGWRRLTVWLNPQEADALQTLGEAWLAGTVKTLLADPMAAEKPRLATDPMRNPRALQVEQRLTAALLAERGRTIALLFRIGISAADIAALLHLDLSEVLRVLSPVPDAFSVSAEPAVPEDPSEHSDLMLDVDTLLAQGLSGAEIAWRFNAMGRRAAAGAEYSGARLIRDWRRWKRSLV